MKKIINKKNIIILLVMIFILSLSIVINSVSTIEDVKFTGIVNTEKLNMRQGPGEEYNIIGSLKFGDTINIIGKINQWYIVQTMDNKIGVCSKDYINNLEDNNKVNEMFDLINEKRKEQGIQELKLDKDLCKLAQIKAEDMVTNNYFAHESPNLGNPFEMMKNNNIEYMTAGENIAGYKDVEGSVNAWMNSNAHKENILSNGYNYTGIGVVKSEEYGYIFVQLFMGKYEN